MNNLILTGIAGAVVVAGAVGGYLYVRRQQYKKQIFASTEQIEGELQFCDVVSYFRDLDLNEKKDTPFIANGKSTQFQDVAKGIITPRIGYDLLMIGVFDEKKDEILHAKFIFSKGWNEKLTNVMGGEDLVVLS